MLRKYPLISRVALFVLVPAALACGYAWWQLRQSLPPEQGSVSLPGLARPATLSRDAQGVARIVAASDHDAFFALGMAHAQDRLWQLELQRRIAAGRLAEVFGKASIDQDVWFRTLGLARAARAEWPQLSPAAQESLQAYADGVNAWLATKPALPPEFRLLGIDPQPWTVYDSLAWMKVLALDLGGNYRQEIERLLLGQVLDREKLQVLYPELPQLPAALADLGVRQRDGLARLAQFQGEIQDQLGLGGRYVGSNAWAVSGKLAGGAALLANDPHLGLQIPSLWYMAALKGDRLDVAGATLVGVPVVIFGRNQAIAWGGTNLMADAQDLYFEEVRPDDPSRYRVGDAWVPFDEREETIAVRQDFPEFLRAPLKPLRVKVRSTRHGPVISDPFPLFDQPAALRWTALDADDTSYDAFLALNYAQDWAGFQQALQALVAPALNFVYADREGHIGYLGAGRMPLRKSGDGSLPVPGWDDAHEWTGAIPFAQWPRRFDPPEGFVVSANDKPVGADYPFLISRDFAPPDRARRIAALLREAAAGGKPLDLAAMERIQGDTQSEPARRLLELLLKHEPTTTAQVGAMAVLRDWHGDMRRDSAAATIFNAWMRSLRAELLLDDVRGFWNKPRERRSLRETTLDLDLDRLYAVLTDPHANWCDDVETTDYVETCDDTEDKALDSALLQLRKITGDGDAQDWAWGDVHETVYRHTPFSQINLLRGLFERRIGNGGSPDSVNVASYALDKSGYSQTFGAGFRQLVAMAPGRVEHRYMNSTGQSGNVMSRHYDDMVAPFRDVKYAALDAQAPAASTLQLVPSAARQGGQP